MTPRRRRALEQLRAWESAVRDDAAPAPEACMGGTELRAYASAGKAHAYPLRVPCAAELTRLGLRQRHVAALAWVMAAVVGFGRSGLLITHADMAELLGCSERTAGATMRELAGLGLVIVLPMFAAAGVGHVQLASSYRVSEMAWEVFGVRRGRRGAGGGEGASTICQPSDKPASQDPEMVVSPVGDGSIGSGAEAGTEDRAQPPASSGALPGSGGEGMLERGGRQELARLRRELGTFQRKIQEHGERRVRHALEAVARMAATARPVEPAREPAAPAPVLELDDMHPDDAAWIASRSPGAGRAVSPATKPAEPELDDVIAAANAAWAARFGGGES